MLKTKNHLEGFKLQIIMWITYLQIQTSHICHTFVKDTHRPQPSVWCRVKKLNATRHNHGSLWVSRFQGLGSAARKQLVTWQAAARVWFRGNGDAGGMGTNGMILLQDGITESEEQYINHESRMANRRCRKMSKNRNHTNRSLLSRIYIHSFFYSASSSHV